MDDIEEYFYYNIEKSWDKCLKVWRKNGRIEDLPRNLRVPKYRPAFGKMLGLEFAARFKDQYSYVISKLHSNDNVESLCAFECLEYICWEFGYGNVPIDIFDILIPLPEKIIEEIHGDADAPNFNGSKIGEFLRYKFLEEYAELLEDDIT